MNKRLKLLIKLIDNVVIKYPETKEFVGNNMKKVCEEKIMTVEEVIYYVGFVLLSGRMTFCS